MTALSFILGVLPLVFASGAGAASRTSIGYVVLSGMVAATVVGVVFVPVLYWVVERVVMKYLTSALIPEPVYVVVPRHTGNAHGTILCI